VAGSDLTGKSIGGGGFVWEMARALMFNCSTGLVGTEVVGEAEGIGEFL
jgi:hypothetical protein